jgi:ubiquinone/menaquinone biosynthesis C-methylase UbiE
MKRVKDNFSIQSDGYNQFRPTYPEELLVEVLGHVQQKERCWDCATGNGQIAIVLAEHFQEVMASDISDAQLSKASARNNIRYINCRAEETGFEDDTFDLVTVGQAVHWFDHHHFNEEVRRVAKPEGVIALIGYGLLYVEPKFDELFMKFYEETLGGYWDPERKHIDSHYQSIPFPFDPIPLTKEYSIDVNWNLGQLQGYLQTWTSVNKYVAMNKVDPVISFIEELEQNQVWNRNEVKQVRFPLFV